jgi:hypothetical protein
MSLLLTAAATAAGQGISSWLSKRNQQNALNQAWNRANTALGSDAIGQAFAGAQRRYAPTVSAMSNDVSLQNQAVGTSIQAGMNLSGLGSTGIGQALAGGARQGASFRNRQLVADLDRSAMQEALQIQTQKANAALALTGPAMQAASINPLASAMQGASAGAGAYQNYQYGQEMSQYRSDYMDLLKKNAAGPQPNALVNNQPTDLGAWYRGT